jgi:hypothetical protein
VFGKCESKEYAHEALFQVSASFSSKENPAPYRESKRNANDELCELWTRKKGQKRKKMAKKLLMLSKSWRIGIWFETIPCAQESSREPLVIRFWFKTLVKREIPRAAETEFTRKFERTGALLYEAL